MKISCSISLLCILTAGASSPAGAAATAPATPANEALAREMLEVTGADKQLDQAVAVALTTMRKQYSGLPDGFWSDLQSKMSRDLAAEIVPLYARSLTADEMSAALAFYRTPAGQTMVRKVPEILQESMQIGRDFAGSAEQVVKDAVAEYQRTHPGVFNDRQAQRQTIADERSVGTALMSWAVDHDEDLVSSPCTKDPANFGGCVLASHAAVTAALVSLYMKEVPEKDGWGHPFQYVFDPKTGAVGVRSPGRDGKYEADSYSMSKFSPDEYDHDLIWWNGYFIRWPAP